MRAVACACLLALGAASVARASTQSVAVMPFKDLAGGRGDVGEAVRETVTADLRGLGLKVVERSSIDRVLVEQNLAPKRADLDAISTIRIGTLVGATLMVVGAYQREGTSIRLTARFVRVETGEVVGSAKVDGEATEFLRLQDRVTAELLRSAGLPQQGARAFARPPRPKVKMRAVELYGAAVVEPDDEKKSAILHQAVAADPTFTYASAELDALEQRMRGYASSSAVALDKTQRDLEQRIAAERDPVEKAHLQQQLLAGFSTTRRYRAQQRASRALVESKDTEPSVVEQAGFFLVTADQALKDWDAVLQDGERFLHRHPASPYFKAVESFMQLVITDCRQQAEGKARLAEDLRGLSERERWSLCAIARVYVHAVQRVEGQRLLRACVDTSVAERGRALLELVRVDLDLGDWSAARRDLKLLDEVPGGADLRRSYESMVPSDG